ncbi:MAG: Uma2 family endonuclease [Myxococcota bacterium]
MDRYARAGVGWVWLVDPVAHAVEVYQLDGATYRFLGGVLAEDTARLPPFEAVAFDLREWWIHREPERIEP